MTESTEEKKVRTYQDVVEKRGLEPPIVPAAELEGVPLIIQSVRPARTQFGDCLYVIADTDDRRFAFFTSGVVLVRKLLEVVDDLPLKAMIVKVKRYYDLM